MCNKLTKTIALIVFVVFLGINKVDASAFKTCVYNASGHYPVAITIDESFNNATISASNLDGNEEDVTNWKDKKSGFSGYEYFQSHGQVCPPFIMVDNNVQVYFTDSSSASTVKKYIDGETALYELQAEMDGSGMHGNPANTNSNKKITTKKCSCSGKNGNKNISIDFDVTDSLELTTAKVVINGEKSTKVIENWSRPYGNSKYTYLTDLYLNNKCPETAIVAESPTISAWKLLVSSKVDLLSVVVEAQDYGNNLFGDTKIYTASCQEVEKNSNSNSNKNTEKKPVEYEDPGVNSNVKPLVSTFTTYSCGDGYLTGIPKRIPKLTKFIYIFLQVLVPIAIIILGSIDLIKAMTGQKEDDIKRGQLIFIKRLIGAVLVFFVFAVVKFAVSLISNNSSNIIDCVDCFLKDNSSCVGEE